MGSIDQNLQPCAGVEKERRCGNSADCTRALEQRLTLVDRWIAQRATERCRSHPCWACNRHGETRRWGARSWRRVDVISRRAGLIFDLCRFSDARRFDADFLKNRRSAGEPSAQRFDKAIVTFCSFGTGCGARLLWERWRRRQPKADEETIVSSVMPSLRSSRSSTRTMRSSRFAMAASRRSESSGERNDAIAASATKDFGLS